MSGYIVNGFFVTSELSIPITCIQKVQVKKRLWFWLVGLVQLWLVIQLVKILLAWGGASGDSDAHDMLIGLLLGNVIIFVVLGAVQYFFAGTLVVETGSRKLKLNMNLRSLEEAEREISLALARAVPQDQVAQLSPAKEQHDPSRGQGLIQSEVNAISANQPGVPRLINAAAEGQVRVVTALIEAGANVNFQSSSGITAISIASENGHAEVVTELLKGGADPNLADSTGSTALHYAASKGHVDVARILIRGGARVNACGDSGFTPLHVATLNGQADTVKLLLECGADVGAKAEGLTTLDLATEEGHPMVAGILRRAYANGKEIHAVQMPLVSSRAPTGTFSYNVKNPDPRGRCVCGASHSAGANFCIKCGKALP